MQTQMQAEEQERVQTREEGSGRRWGLTKRVGFRFAFAYLVLYCLPFPFDNSFPYIGSRILRYYNELWYAVVPWVGRHVLRLSGEMPINRMGGSGDTTFGYTQVLCFLMLAAVATAVWSLLDRKRASYTKFDQWLRLYVRLYLAHYMIIYGAMKAIPVQMGPSFLSKLLLPYGESSPMGVLWNFMGASPAYQSFTGWVELLAGILLILPYTAFLGTLVSLAATAQVFLLNMCYDVPVKLFSFHLVLVSVFLLAPHMRRLADMVVLNRRVEPAQAPPFFRRRRFNQGLVALQLVFGVYLVYSQLSAFYRGYYSYGAGGPKPPYYGIWDVEEFTVDGEVRPPLLTDQTRWHRLVVDRYYSIIHSMKGEYMPSIYQVQIDSEKKLLKLTGPGGQSEMSIEEAEPGRLLVSGNMNGKSLQIKMSRYDESKFFLNSRGFNWIQERPVNR